MPLTLASAPVKILAAFTKESLPVFHLYVSRAFVQAPLKQELYMRSPDGCGEFSCKVVRLLK